MFCLPGKTNVYRTFTGDLQAFLPVYLMIRARKAGTLKRAVSS